MPLQYKKLLTVMVCSAGLCTNYNYDHNFSAGATAETKLMKLNDFLFESHMDNVNLFKLIQYCQRSEISRKVVTKLNSA